MSVLQPAPETDPNRLTPDADLQVWWLGQAGFLVVQGGLRIVIDAYLSDSLAEKYRGTRFPHERMMPPPVAPADLTGVDWVLCTHGHTDHMDPGTLPALLAANPQARALVPRAEKARAVERGVPADRLVTIDAGETVDLGGVSCTAIPAAHEEMARNAEGFLYLGYVLSGGGVAIWHSGDTIPWSGQTEWLVPFRIDLALLPVNGRDAVRAANGVPGNLTLDEAIGLADAIGARAMLGHHFGLFGFNTLDPQAGRARLSRLPHATEAELVRENTAYRIAPAQPARGAVLFVCNGDIRASPTAEAVLRKLLPAAEIDSAAIPDWNIGRTAHETSCAVAPARKVDLSGLPARQVAPEDFDSFDLILAMDSENEAALVSLRPERARARVGLLGAYLAPGSRPDIEDPSGKTGDAFEMTFGQIEAACRRLASLILAADKQGRKTWTSD